LLGRNEEMGLELISLLHVKVRKNYAASIDSFLTIYFTGMPHHGKGEYRFRNG
jgi:hypothetical protein